jgi:uncharacterized protein (TIGR02001 family)
MKSFKTLATTAIILAATISSAHADEADKPAGEFSGTLTMVSDYVFRGLTQNDEHPALQGSFDYEHSNGLYAGVWGSNVDFNDGGQTSMEADIYGGFKFFSEGVNWDAGAIGYYYPGSHQSTDHYNYLEAKIAANKTFGTLDATAQLYYSPNNFADSGDSVYINLGGTVPISDSGFSLSAAAGYQWIENNTNFGLPDYADWSAGIEYAWQGFDFDLKYTDTDLSKNDCADGCEARGVFSVAKSF